MSVEWGAIFRAVLSPVVRWLPGWALRRWYPVRKCQEYLTVEAHGVGPHIYVNPGRPPVITGLNLSLMNGLPFAVKLESVHLEVSVESYALTNHDHFVRESVPGAGVRQIRVNDIHLSDGQADVVRRYECPILRVTGHAACEAPVGGFKKNLLFETRAFIYRGGDDR